MARLLLHTRQSELLVPTLSNLRSLTFFFFSTIPTPLSASTLHPFQTPSNRLEETIHPARCARPWMDLPFPKLLQLLKQRVMRWASQFHVTFNGEHGSDGRVVAYEGALIA